jgi:mono/diheme cytochrome c family protein
MWYRSSLVVLLGVTLVGCGKPEVHFRFNEAYLESQQRSSQDFKFTKEQKQEFATALVSMFGTPDEPFVPASGDAPMTDVVSLSRLRMAAGPVGKDEHGNVRGLYRQHCVHCHGITGDGAGPTAAFLNPYPRDYRKGTYKAKSTPAGAPPTHDDLRRILVNGIPGTAMPSFKLLPDNEIDALVDYVKYLSIRGQTERMLIVNAIDNYSGPEDSLDMSPDYLIGEVLTDIVASWRDAGVQMPEIAARPELSEEERQVSIEKGRELFYGATANCFSCHGQAQLGDGQKGNHDAWTKDFYDFDASQNPEERAQMAEDYANLTGLEVRTILPRNLRSGTFRFGRRPVDLYLRILHGIDGTPMPAAALLAEGDPVTAKKLSSEDIWHLVDYVQSLPYEPQGGEQAHETTYQRDRL